MIDKLLRNARTAFHHPDQLPQYAGYVWRRLINGDATRRMPWGDKIGGFVNFSEYRSATHCLDKTEQLVLTQLAEVMRAMVSHDKPIFDIGANLGVTTLFLAHLFPDAPIHSFEPAPTTFSALQSNINRSGYDNISCYQLAVSDVQGEVQFDVQPESRANARMVGVNSVGVTVHSTHVDKFCLDRSIDQISLMKVDTEGYEHRVFSGARRLLKDQAVGVIFYEFCPSLESSAGAEIGSALRLLQKSGYESYTIDHHGALKEFSLKKGLLPELCNLVAIPSKKKQRFAQVLPRGLIKT